MTAQPSTNLPQIPGYSLFEQLYNGSKTAVYRALQDHQQQPVVIKVLQREYPSFSELLQFRNQYTIAKNIDTPGIVKPLKLVPWRNSFALVMEDVGGLSLKQYTQNQPLDYLEVLVIAQQLAEILHYLTQHRVVHKDIKPANILICPQSKQIKLIDFSIATLLPKETQELKNPNILEGTLAYIAPEQTGRMNRGIDYRTDFYSLGVTLYELLTGQLPFSYDDPLELVHCHIAKIPAALKTGRWGDKEMGGKVIPQMVSDIVMKLMAKNAEDRYQSALGLKYDLENCIIQAKETGTIIPFKLAQKDISDRFNIPEKLYGRETEVQTLLNAFERVAEGKTEMMLVAGFSGIGKTAVVNEVHKPIVRQKGYFIKGKFDGFNRNIPFSAFVQALRDLMGQLLSESDTQLQQWKNKILDAVGENGQVIIEVIPELEKIIGQQPPVTELSGSAAQNRFNLLFSKFIQVFTTKEHPLVIFLDDLQWADLASLSLIQLLMSEASSSYLLMIGAYRDNEVFPSHPLMLTLNEISKAETTINTITLSPLSQNNINSLVADTLSCGEVFSQPLTDLIYQKTKGNPFFTTQFILGLYEEKLIQFNCEAGHWECNITQVRQRALTDDIVKFMAQRLQKLPEETQAVLKLAGAIGNQFDLQTLAIVCQQSEGDTATALWKALQESFILPQSEVYKFYIGQEKQENLEQSSQVAHYKFLHDRVQQAAYSLIPDEQKQSTHLHIGSLLIDNLSKQEQENQIFTIVNHWNQAIELIVDETAKDQLIHLNLTAGQKAKATAAYGAALQYFKIALSLMDSESWHKNYPLTLQLHEANAEAAYLTGDFELMETLIDQVLNGGKDLLDLVKVYEIKIQADMAQTQQLSALDIGIQFLGLLGIQVPDSPQPEDLQVEIAAISQAMAGKAIADLAHLPLMEDKKQLAKVNILANLVPACYQAKPSLLPWVNCKLMQLLIQYGNTPQSAFAYANYGMVCILVLQDFTSAAEYGKLASQLDLNPQTGDGVGATNVAGACLLHYSSHVRDGIPLLLKAYQTGLETGNFQFGGFAMLNRSQYLYFMGRNLSSVKQEIAAASHALATMKQGNTLAWNQAFEQAVLNLLEESDTPWKLVGIAYDETESLSFQIAANDRTGLHFVYLNKLILCYLFGQISQAVENATLAESYLDGVTCLLSEYAFNFYDSLTQLARYSHAEISEQKSILDRVQANQLKMQYWANHAPMNGQHKVDLVEAEKCRVLGQNYEAGDYYDRAIAGAKANEYTQEVALANELAAKFYLNWNKEKVAAGYLQEAYYCYAKWGAKAKIHDLEKRYPNLLQPILQRTAQTLDPLQTLCTLTQSHNSINHSTITSHTSSNNINNTLDFAAVLRASQALSGTIQLDELLRQLTQIILQNSGGERCGLILPDINKEWSVKAITTLEGTELSSQPLDNNANLPIKLIQYVKNTQEVVVIDNLKTDLPVIDEYLLTKQPQSLLCLPILNQSNLIGILYLTNLSISGAFTTERILILNFLCTQAAISLENARLYQQAQDYAQQLEDSQLQIVQSEKMASLGNLMAGVAHEINNPLGFLNGSITNIDEYFQEMIEHFELYHQYYPNVVEPIQENAEEIDLEFLCEDIPNLLDSMQLATKRIKNISTSLRSFSRADMEYKVSADIHQGLDSTLMILKYRLKANENRPEIAVVKHYEALPEIMCFPGQLNQVFMNIIANAIDVFDEAAQDLSKSNLEEKPQQITIKTAQITEKNVVEITISDNGKGMPPEVKQRIFDHLFTTKAVGKGTGLGLAIARQIIADKHGGSLQVESSVGQGTQFRMQLPIVSEAASVMSVDHIVP
ncbi:MAG: AAA family ATPase [Microcoleaceae cyanobacterium]